MFTQTIFQLIIYLNWVVPHLRLTNWVWRIPKNTKEIQSEILLSINYDNLVCVKLV